MSSSGRGSSSIEARPARRTPAGLDPPKRIQGPVLPGRSAPGVGERILELPVQPRHHGLRRSHWGEHAIPGIDTKALEPSSVQDRHARRGGGRLAKARHSLSVVNTPRRTVDCLSARRPGDGKRRYRPTACDRGRVETLFVLTATAQSPGPHHLGRSSLRFFEAGLTQDRLGGPDRA